MSKSNFNTMSSREIVDEFLSNPELQESIIAALNFCAVLSAVVAEAHGFHDDERDLEEYITYGARQHDADPEAALSWFRSQLLQAEFGRIVSEAGEAIENLRKPGPDSHCPEFPGWQVEAIDAMIRLFDTLGKRAVRPGEIFIAKMQVNNSRPRKHGTNS